MPDGGFAEAAAAVAEWWAAYGVYVEAALVVAAAYTSYQAAEQARQRYNNSLRDRYVMQRTSTGQRSLVLGRARVSGPIAFMQSYGTNQATLALVVVLAGHECDAIETVYFNDQPIIIDNNGNVTGVVNTEHYSVNSSAPLNVLLAVKARPGTVTAVAQYSDAQVTLGTSLAGDHLHLTITGARATGVADVKVTYQPEQCQFTPTQLVDQTHTETAAASSGSFTFPAIQTTYGNWYAGFIAGLSQYTAGPVSGTSVVVVQTVSGVQTALSHSFTLDGFGNASSVSWTGATVGATVQVTYQTASIMSRARVRMYRGAPGQTADAKLIAALPGMWTSNHVGTGLAYVVVELDYDQAAFSAGLPNVSATVRGAKVYDPRSNSTAWSENPAILARGYWTHALGANLPSTQVDDNAVIAAANVCDNQTFYLVGPTLIPRPAPKYTAGYVATKDMKPQDVLTDLCAAMGGRWVITGNTLRVKAGGFTSPVASIDNTWLTSESSVRVSPLPSRQDLFNSVQGTFCDETNDYRQVPYPKQVASALATSDGRDLPLNLDYAAVTKTAQVQYLASCAIRYNRAGMTIQMSCNLKAFPLEVFDVVSVTLPRFGFVNQTFEVTDTAFTPDGLISLSLKYIDSSIWAVDSSYQLTAYAPKTNLPEPWDVQVPVLGTAQTGAAQLLQQADGTVVSRIFVPITMNDVTVISGGYMDVAYMDAADAAGSWNMLTIAGSATGVYIVPVKDGHTYQIKARSRNTLFSSPWSSTISVTAAGKSAGPSGVAGLTYNATHGQIFFFWTACPDTDYKETRIQYGPVGTTGNVWDSGSMTQVFRGNADRYTLTSPGAGVYEVQVRHYNWSGAATASSTISVTATDTMSHILDSAAQTATWSSITGTGKPSDNATTDLVLLARGNCVTTGNVGTKVGGSAAWDSDIYSADSYTGAAYASAVVVDIAHGVMFGLNSDPTTDSSYTSLDYAWYVSGDGHLSVYESGTSVLSGLTPHAGDVLSVVYDGVRVSYFQNGALARVTNVASGLKLFLDSSFNEPGGSLKNIRFGPMSNLGNVVVGGRNLALNSSVFTSAVWTYSSATPGATGQTDPVGGTAGMLVTLTAGSGSTFDLYRGIGGLIVGQQYTASVWVKLGTATNFCLTLNNSAAWNTGPSVSVTGAGWQRVSLAFTADSHAACNIHLGAHENTGTNQNAGTVTLAFLQFEQGNTATQWIPAPEDVSAGIATAATTANWPSVSGTPSNLAALGGSEAIQNTQITVNGSGQLVGIGSGNGTAVDNNLLTSSISDKVSKSANSILSATVSIGATAGAGFVAGTLTWNASGVRTGGYGVAMTPAGLVGYNTSGVATFSIDATTGNAYFGGTLKAGIASTGVILGSAASTSANGSSVVRIISSTMSLISLTTQGGDVLVNVNCNAAVQCNTNTPTQMQLYVYLDGVLYDAALDCPQVEVTLTNSSPMQLASGTGATAYNWGATQCFDYSFIIPSASIPAGSHTISAQVDCHFYNASGGGNVITGTSLYCRAKASTREFIA